MNTVKDLSVSNKSYNNLSGISGMPEQTGNDDVGCVSDNYFQQT